MLDEITKKIMKELMVKLIKILKENGLKVEDAIVEQSLEEDILEIIDKFEDDIKNLLIRWDVAIISEKIKKKQKNKSNVLDNILALDIDTFFSR